MQPDKNTKNISDLKPILLDSEKMTSSLADMIEVFNLKKHFSKFNSLKNKGLVVSSLLQILLLLPFYGVASIYALFKSGIKNNDFQGQKDTLYDTKNNENIDWRYLLILHVKRFKYLTNNNINLKKDGITAIIFDDTKLEKTGKKIEKVSFVHDHVSGRFILGFKLLVCGFWDGASFIPLDFSLHREKGTLQEKLRKEYKKAFKQAEKTKIQLDTANKRLQKKEDSWVKFRQSVASKPTRTNQLKLEKAEATYKKPKQNSKALNKEYSVNQKIVVQKKREIKQHYANGKLFGLTNKERKEQYKKVISSDSHGNKRRREADIDKIQSMLIMLGRVVKLGFIPEYVLTDSWFFCYELLAKLQTLKKGTVKLVSMVKINNQIFTDQNGKRMAVNTMPELYRKQIKKCSKLKSKYIKIACFYQGIRVNVFFVKMGKSNTWHLLLTTDLNLSFIKIMEIYQIRWSIEGYFKESKQYLNLENCKSSCFDGHIADITISMLQHIMLSYYKRLNYMQTFGELFKDVKKEFIELDLITRLLEIFWELIQLICDTAGIDFIDFQEDIFNNEEFLTKFVKLFPEKTIDKAA